MIFGIDLFGNAIEPKKRGRLERRFVVPPFSVLDARQGYWQDRKRAWLSLGIQGELGRGGGRATPSHPPTVTQNPDGTLNYGGTAGQAKRFDRQRGRTDGRTDGLTLKRFRSEPGGSARPATNYSERRRGDGRGRPIDG